MASKVKKKSKNDVVSKVKKNGDAKGELDNFREIYDVVWKQARYFRKKFGVKFDGRKWWQGIKNYLKKYDHVKVSFKKVGKSLDKKIMSLAEFHIDGCGEHRMVDTNHFLIQHVRLTSQPGSIRKAMQIALNSGQYCGQYYNDPSLYVQEFRKGFVSSICNHLFFVT